ncbi:PHA/PHB synthase family protein [Aurantivibrio plasticivorans]
MAQTQGTYDSQLPIASPSEQDGAFVKMNTEAQGQSDAAVTSPTKGAAHAPASEATEAPSEVDATSVEQITHIVSRVEQASESLLDEFASEEADDELQAKLNKLRNSANALKAFAKRVESQYGRYPRAVELDIAAVGATQPINDESIEQEAAAPELEAEQLEEDKETDFPGLDGTSKGVFDSIFTLYTQMLKKPLVFAKHYESFALEMLKVVRNKSDLIPQRGDHRFRDAVWHDNPFYRTVMQTYIACHKECKALVDDLDFEEQDRLRSQFLVEQFAAALSPSNSPLNPSAVKRAFQTGGQSLLTGLKNFIDDVENNNAMPRQISPDSFTVGGDLGITPGVVVFRTEKLELIQYNPTQATVYKKPIFIVPPQINKFYVFDLSPKNSIVNYLLDQGFQVFIVSWKNPNKSHAHWGLDQYIDDIEKAMDATLEITNSPDLSLVSACAGGITSMSLLAHLGKKGKKIVKNHSLLVTALQIGHHPTLSLFLTEDSIARVLKSSRKRGVMEGKELAHVFAWLRPTDLVWNYWVNNYLLGKEPPSLDVLFWDNDPTRLPAALHRDFVDIFVNNRFSEDIPLMIKGEEVNLRDIDADTYFLAGEEDYLMPWKNCYKNLQLLDAKCEFVLSDSGHIQSVLRPPGIGRTTYYTGDTSMDNAEDWKEAAVENKGSWWEHWKGWLSERSGEEKPAPTRLGSEMHPPICASPGEYVFEK